MENEVQKRRTFEILAKFVAEKNGVTVNFEPDKVQCDVKTKTITLPSNVQAKNIYPALAWLMHEAAHIRYTMTDPEKIVNDEVDFNILNSVEDIRIDKKNFNLLPNVKGIYEEMVKFITSKNKEKMKDAPIEAKVLCDCILMEEGFTEYSSKDPVVREFIDRSGIREQIRQLEGMLDCRYHYEDHELKKQIKVIRDLLVLAREKQKKQPKPKPDPNGKDKGDSDGKPDGNNQNKQPVSKDKLDLSAVKRNGSSGFSREIFGALDKNPCNPSALGAASLNERTRNDFKELLNLKEQHRVEDGAILDTDNLTAYFLGTPEELFKDEVIVKRKKSKIIIVMDSSGSMCAGLNLEKNTDKKSVASMTVKAIVDILKEVQEIEGLSVDYEIRAFNDSYHTLKKDSWEKDYRCGGGTNLSHAFERAQEELLNDYTVEGKRMVLLLTDGEVDDSQIKSMQDRIISKNADVRALIIGIGVETNGFFIKKISGHNIMKKEHADVILMEAIQEMMV